jgi:very-short-patch-repair endonuclease
MADKLHRGAAPDLFSHARENRQGMTKAEEILWECLRNRRLNGSKFRRQHPVADFIADFFCLECSLAIEVDGCYHNTDEQAQNDKERTRKLNDLNIKMIRFTNQAVTQNLDLVLKEIRSHLTSP